MDWITEQVAIGNRFEAQDLTVLRMGGFRAILSLDGSLLERDAMLLGVDVVRSFQLIDGEGQDRQSFFQAIEDLCQLVDQHPPVLVHCHAGRSRAPTVVAGYLIRSRQLSARDAIAFVAERRHIQISYPLLHLLDRL